MVSEVCPPPALAFTQCTSTALASVERSWTSRTGLELRLRAGVWLCTIPAMLRLGLRQRSREKEACVCLSIHADTHELEAGTLPGPSGWSCPRPVLARVESLIRV